MLFDILGVLLGFSTVMLLLSLVVTALVEATQAAVRLRARNLRWGLGQLLEAEGLATSDQSTAAATNIMKAQTGGVSASALSVRAIEQREFTQIISDAQKIEQQRSAGKTASGTLGPYSPRLGAAFGRMEKTTRDRYRRFIRGITIAWSIAIAALYQVSAPALLQHLSENPELREQYAAAAGTAAIEARSALEPVSADASIEKKALVELGQNHPTVAAQLAEGVDSGQLVAELEVLAEGSSEDDLALLEEFERIQARLYREQIDHALSQAARAGTQLSALGIYALGGGWAFYKDAANLAGTAMTAILLTLGAPFWFQQITTLTRLRAIFASSETKP